MPSGSSKRRTEELDRMCREHALPVTVQRRLVFEAMMDRHDHPTADQIYDSVTVRMPDISRTTVYRILETFVQLGLITKVCHPGSAARFDPKIHRHHHLVCMHCDNIMDLEDRSLDQLAWPDVRAYGFQIRDYHIHFRGVCADCGRRQRKGGTRAGRAETRTLKRRTRRRTTQVTK